MSVLSQQNKKSTIIAENTDVSLDWGFGNEARWKIAAPALQKRHSLSLFHKKKIIKVRQQLAEGTYDIDKRLNAVLDCVLDDIAV
jgi:anti-sigma28 factor (negative regulator of flagellin synthesis)